MFLHTSALLTVPSFQEMGFALAVRLMLCTLYLVGAGVIPEPYVRKFFRQTSEGQAGLQAIYRILHCFVDGHDSFDQAVTCLAETCSPAIFSQDLVSLEWSFKHKDGRFIQDFSAAVRALLHQPDCPLKIDPAHATWTAQPNAQNQLEYRKVPSTVRVEYFGLLNPGQCGFNSLDLWSKMQHCLRNFDMFVLIFLRNNPPGCVLKDLDNGLVRMLFDVLLKMYLEPETSVQGSTSHNPIPILD